MTSTDEDAANMHRTPHASAPAEVVRRCSSLTYVVVQPQCARKQPALEGNHSFAWCMSSGFDSAQDTPYHSSQPRPRGRAALALPAGRQRPVAVLPLWLMLASDWVCARRVAERQHAVASGVAMVGWRLVRRRATAELHSRLCNECSESPVNTSTPGLRHDIFHCASVHVCMD